MIIARDEQCNAALPDPKTEDCHIGNVVPTPYPNSENLVQTGLSLEGLRDYRTPYGWVRRGNYAYGEVGPMMFPEVERACREKGARFLTGKLPEEIQLMDEMCSPPFCWTGN